MNNSMGPGSPGRSGRLSPVAKRYGIGAAVFSRRAAAPVAANLFTRVVNGLKLLT